MLARSAAACTMAARLVTLPCDFESTADMTADVTFAQLIVIEPAASGC